MATLDAPAHGGDGIRHVKRKSAGCGDCSRIRAAARGRQRMRACRARALSHIWERDGSVATLACRIPGFRCAALVQTSNPVRLFGPKVCVSGASAASRPRATRIGLSPSGKGPPVSTDALRLPKPQRSSAPPGARGAWRDPLGIRPRRHAFVFGRLDREVLRDCLWHAIGQGRGPLSKAAAASACSFWWSSPRNLPSTFTSQIPLLRRS